MPGYTMISKQDGTWPYYAHITLADSDSDNRYITALQLIETIDTRLEAGYHYRAADGRLLTTLDDVVRALLDGGLKVADGGKVA